MLRLIATATAVSASTLPIVACTTGDKAGPRPGVNLFGLATCQPKDMAYCNGLANHTHRGWGPEQIEYIAGDGQLYLWVGDKIRRGRWHVGGGLAGSTICYQYEQAPGGPHCEQLSSELSMKDKTIPGDPFGLATLKAPPFPLKTMDRRDFNQLLAEIAAQKASQPVNATNPEG